MIGVAPREVAVSIALGGIHMEVIGCKMGKLDGLLVWRDGKVDCDFGRLEGF